MAFSTDLEVFILEFIKRGIFICLAIKAAYAKLKKNMTDGICKYLPHLNLLLYFYNAKKNKAIINFCFML